MHKNQMVLGLDLGTSSIGWSLVKQGIDESSGEVDFDITNGSRIFPEGMDRTRGEKSLNQDRQQARAIRRQLYRRARRKLKIENLLVRLELLPEDKARRELLFSDKLPHDPQLGQQNPYAYRALALDQKLQPYQLGRALYHLSQRRGYLSNRKAGDEKDGVVAAGISEIQQKIQAANCRTLGEYFYKIKDQQKIRGVYTHRQMFVDEFNAIWQAQAPYHPQLTKIHRQAVFDAIFYQRPLKIQKHLLGQCELEPERRRAYAATLHAQDFRLWQSINNIKVLLQSGAERTLDVADKQSLFEFIYPKKSRSWKAIKKHLGLFDGDSINLEKSRPSGLQGNITAAIVINAVKDTQWKAWSVQQQEQLVFDLINIESEQALLKRLTHYWQLPEDIANGLCDASLAFPKGTMRFSHKAIRTILPSLQRGLTLDKAIVEAGYRDKKNEIEQISLLPLFNQDLRNPLVTRALFQVRRVVNAVIKQYGMPDIIRVEMARDLRNNAKRRADIQDNQRKLEKLNNQAKEAIVQYGIANPSRQDKLKFRLWKECDFCPFTGREIGFHQLFNGEVDIEHIIPYSQCLDDSYMNKTLCYREENQKKGNRTPAEAYSGARYEEILSNIKKLPRKKRERFGKDTEKFTRDFVSQQLNETGYIARETVAYLKQLGCKVETVKGGVTAKLRYAWGLNSLLSGTDEKTREDHRHHAVDATVVALTDRKAVKLINDHSRLRGQRMKIVDYPLPHPEFRNLVKQAIEQINVSFKTQHKVKGALHDETLYGVGERDEQGNPKTVVIRKPLIQLKEKDLDLIRDEGVKKLAKTHLGKYDSYKQAFVEFGDSFGFVNHSGELTPIRSVRLEYPLKVQSIGKGKRLRHIKTGGNHHVEIFQTANKKGQVKWRGEVISTLHASERQKQQQPVVAQQDAEGNPLACALHINDMLLLDIRGERVLCRLQKMTQKASGQVEITLRHHVDASMERSGEISKSPESLRTANAQQVYIDVLGQLRGIKH